MNLIRRICSWLMVVVVLVCLTVVFNAVGTGVFALTGDDAFFFAIAATGHQ